MSIQFSQSERFAKNKQNGLLAEKIAVDDFVANGFGIKKTGIGSDFIAFKNNRPEYPEIVKKPLDTVKNINKYLLPV